MIIMFRSHENPILIPNPKYAWEAEATFNGCPVQRGQKIYLTYRALSSVRFNAGVEMNLSTIGLAESYDGIHFQNRRQIIKPEYDWENFGCEDPRITRVNGKYYIFYTALSTYPFSADGIRVAVAITRDFKTFEKHLVTPFNAKAMALFPRRINGRLVAVLTANTDKPPAKIGLAFFDNEDQIWSRDYWEDWYANLDKNCLPLQKTPEDHIEVGAPPIDLHEGWLLIFSYIKNYFSPHDRTFSVDAVLLDKNDPSKIITRTHTNLLYPEEEYELYGQVPRIVFPSGALKTGDKIQLYYGAADTTCALAEYSLQEIFVKMGLAERKKEIFKRATKNPILSPIENHPWEARAVFNPAAFYHEGRVHLVYRGASQDLTSSFGYASSSDGFKIDERLDDPIYIPREDFEIKKQPGNSGCEDPRLTLIGKRLYMLYTAFDAKNPPRVAITSILLKDFLNKNWKWKKPAIISPPNISDKNACIFPEKIKGKYLIFHRIRDGADIALVSDLNKPDENWLSEDNSWLRPRFHKWDGKRVGIAAPPIKTEQGWILFYHGVSEHDNTYRVGAILLNPRNPFEIIARTENPIFEPTEYYEKDGEVPNVVFPCGVVNINDTIIMYYGAADKVIGATSAKIKDVLKELGA